MTRWRWQTDCACGAWVLFNHTQKCRVAATVAEERTSFPIRTLSCRPDAGTNSWASYLTDGLLTRGRMRMSCETRDWENTGRSRVVLTDRSKQ